MSFEKIKKIFSRENSGCFPSFSLRIQLKVFIFSSALLMVAYSVFLWYNCVYKPDWGEDQKKEYLKKKEQGAVFNQKGFDEIVLERELRKKRYDEKIEDAKDIFHLNEGGE